MYSNWASPTFTTSPPYVASFVTTFRSVTSQTSSGNILCVSGRKNKKNIIKRDVITPLTSTHIRYLDFCFQEFVTCCRRQLENLIDWEVGTKQTLIWSVRLSRYLLLRKCPLFTYLWYIYQTLLKQLLLIMFVENSFYRNKNKRKICNIIGLHLAFRLQSPTQLP